jgi:hypothetical protein
MNSSKNSSRYQLSTPDDIFWGVGQNFADRWRYLEGHFDNFISENAEMPSFENINVHIQILKFPHSYQLFSEKA